MGIHKCLPSCWQPIGLMELPNSPEGWDCWALFHEGATAGSSNGKWHRQKGLEAAATKLTCGWGLLGLRQRVWKGWAGCLSVGGESEKSSIGPLVVVGGFFWGVGGSTKLQL